MLTTTAIAVRYFAQGREGCSIEELEVLAPLRKAIPARWFASLGFPFLDAAPLPHGLRWRLSEHLIYAGLSSQSMELLLESHGLDGERQLATSTDDREGEWPWFHPACRERGVTGCRVPALDLQGSLGFVLQSGKPQPIIHIDASSSIITVGRCTRSPSTTATCRRSRATTGRVTCALSSTPTPGDIHQSG